MAAPLKLIPTPRKPMRDSRYYRDRAEECLRHADDMHDTDGRRMMLRIVAQYLALADWAEREDREQREKDDPRQPGGG